MFFVTLSANLHQLMWCTTSRYVNPIRFHCVSLTSCAVGQHTTFDSSTGRPCRSGSLSPGKWQQCPGTKWCELTKRSKCQAPCYHHVRYMSHETLQNPTNSAENLCAFCADSIKLPCSYITVELQWSVSPLSAEWFFPVCRYFLTQLMSSSFSVERVSVYEYGTTTR